MEHTITVILGTVAIYLALFLLVAVSPKTSRKLIAGAATATVVFGLLFYGFCLASIHPEHPLLAMIKTCHAVLLQFLGDVPEDLIKGADIMQRVSSQVIISALCFLGVFSTASAAFSAVGAGFLRKVRMYLWRKKSLAIVQPLNPNTLEFARELVTKKGCMVVFADKKPDRACLNGAMDLGCVVRSDSDALSGNTAFLRSIGTGKGKRKIFLYALSDDRFANRQYAQKILASLNRRNIPSGQTELTIFADEDQTQNDFLCTDSCYGFGNVLCVNEEQMAARLLLQNAPLWQTVSFDDDGRATSHFHALVIGSGKVGQSVIKQIVMNGQFAGSRFHLSVFDPEFDSVTGRLRYECPQLFANYDIDIYCADARSAQMYAFLSENWQGLHYIVVCTGDDRRNNEISRQLRHFLDRHQSALPVHICSRRGLCRITAADIQRWNIFTPDVLCSDEMDTLAMVMNQSYCQGNGKTARQNWADCDYFSRMSSRASADYAPTFLKMAGLSEDADLSDNWVTPQQLENMAISEHERWCAFHYCMGFRAMTEEEFETRCQTYREEKAKNPATRYRIGKDLVGRIHCCLIPWEQLDDLSARENAVTGGTVDYKAMDRNNVLTLPGLLRSAKEYKND